MVGSWGRVGLYRKWSNRFWFQDTTLAFDVKSRLYAHVNGALNECGRSSFINIYLGCDNR